MGNRSVSHVEVGRALMTPGELMQMPDADQLLLIAGKHPIKAKKITYFDDPAFAAKYKGKKLSFPQARAHDFPPYQPTPWDERARALKAQRGRDEGRDDDRAARDAYVTSKVPTEQLEALSEGLDARMAPEAAMTHMTGQIDRRALDAIRAQAEHEQHEQSVGALALEPDFFPWHDEGAPGAQAPPRDEVDEGGFDAPPDELFAPSPQAFDPIDPFGATDSVDVDPLAPPSGDARGGASTHEPFTTHALSADQLAQIAQDATREESP